MNSVGVKVMQAVMIIQNAGGRRTSFLNSWSNIITSKVIIHEIYKLTIN